MCFARSFCANILHDNKIMHEHIVGENAVRNVAFVVLEMLFYNFTDHLYSNRNQIIETIQI